MEYIDMDAGVNNAVGSSPPPSRKSTANYKKKRRLNSNNAQAAQYAGIGQDFAPPPLLGFGDTLVARNPFDDAPPAGWSCVMYDVPQHILHHMQNPLLRGVNPAIANMDPTMPHMGRINSMNSFEIGNRMVHMSNMPHANLPVNSMNSMNNMRSNMLQDNVPAVRNHIRMDCMMNSSMNEMNHSRDSPMSVPIDCPINKMSPNHMNDNTMTGSGINPANIRLPCNALQPQPDHFDNVRQNRPQNIPMKSNVPTPTFHNNQINDMNMARAVFNHMQNINVNQHCRIEHMENPNPMGIAMFQRGLLAPPLEFQPVPKLNGKMYPPYQPMIINHQNRNAPPISLCGACHTEVHAYDQAILCKSGCNFWFHGRCTGLTQMAYVLLMNEVCAEWVCDRCASSKDVLLVKLKP